jgi:hypothetical protein
MESNISSVSRTLDLAEFNREAKTPFLYETWNWEGDESVLPFKVIINLN